MGFARKFLRAVLNYDPSFCDMYEDEHARRVAEEYLRHITGALAVACGPPPLTIVDAGCQAGRLLIPLAQQGHRLTGIDTSGFALRRTRAHAKRLGLTVALHEGSIAHLGRWVRPQSLDAIVCTEVLYLCRDYREILNEFVKALKPGSLLCVSHRSAAFYLAKAAATGDWKLLESLAARSEGPSPDGDYHNWQTPEQLRRLYQELGCRLEGCEPIEAAPAALTLPAGASPAVRQALDPARDARGAFAIPTYYLVIARRAAA